MKTKNWFMAIIESAIWYAFIYYFLYIIKNPVDLRQGASILLVLSYLGIITCPWIRNTEAWKNMWEDKK